MNKMRKFKPRYRSLSFALTLVCLVLLSACSVSRAPEVDKSYAYRTPEDWYTPDALNVYGEGDLAGDIFTLQAGADASEVGAWSPTANWPIGAIHAIVTPDGNILTYGATDTATSEFGVGGFGVAYDVWDPDKGLGDEAHITLENQTETNIFCSAQIIMPNGQILLTGGSGEEGDETQLGVNDVTQFDYLSNSLADFDPKGSGSPLTMLKGRWYPTLVTLPNGDQLVHGGRDDTLELNPVIYPEIYSQNTKSWRLLDNPANKEAYEQAYGETRDDSGWYYPQSWVAPDGRVFMLNGFTRDLNYLDVSDGSIERTGYLPGGMDWDHRLGGVMFEQSKILAFANARSAMIIDISEEASLNTIENVGDLEKQRIWGETTVLADGKVLISGGGELDENQGQASADAAITYTEIWDPKTKEFTKGPSAEQIRLYHSVAILMPNGAVLTAGGGWPGPVDNYNAEVYYPAYLFNEDGSFAERPILGNVDKVEWGKTFDADLNSASSISRMTLVRAPSITHSFDMGQLFFELDFTQNGDTLSVKAPESANVAPPGFYMLFAIDDKGVPSRAQMVSIGGTRNDIIVDNPGSQTSAGNERVNLQIIAHNPDGEPLSYSATLPDGLSIDSRTGLITGSSVPFNNRVFVTSVTASAGGSSVTQEFTWTITEGSVSPACDTESQFADGAGARLFGDFELVTGAAPYIHVPQSAAGYGFFQEANKEHRAEFCVNAEYEGGYRIKGRVSATSETDNSFYVQVDSGPITVWDTPATGNFEESYVTQRGAVDRMVVGLGIGEHRITVYQREKGARLNSIELEPGGEEYSFCEGRGLAQEAEDGVLYGNFQIGTDASASGGRYVGVPTDADFVWQGASSSQAKYCVAAPSAGSYELRANAASEGAQDGSFFVTLNGQPGAGHLWDVPASSSYQESSVSARGEDTLTLELKAGQNTLTFHQREAGVRLDSFELVKR